MPLLLDIRTAGDSGAPIVAAAPDSDAAKAFIDIAHAVWAKVQAQGAQAGGPKFLVD